MPAARVVRPGAPEVPHTARTVPALVGGGGGGDEAVGLVCAPRAGGGYQRVDDLVGTARCRDRVTTESTESVALLVVSQRDDRHTSRVEAE